MTPKLSLILGSGFSAAIGFPTTYDLTKAFLSIRATSLDQAISDILAVFWADIFGHSPSLTPPSFEEHFTSIDLAANSGHNLGAFWTPKRLRAIRRMSIHRVFQILDEPDAKDKRIQDFFRALFPHYDLSILTLNWDLVCEINLAAMGHWWNYGTPTHVFPFGGQPNADYLPLLKLHGSANWMYCDSCRQIYHTDMEKGGLHSFSYLEASDFSLFETKVDGTRLTEAALIVSDPPAALRAGLISDASRRQQKEPCPECDCTLVGRLSTFSFTKFFALPQFQSVWERARQELIQSDKWLFIGYSLPDADFEFKHLLKTAEMARKSDSRIPARRKTDIKAVIGKNATCPAGKPEVERYRRFFGLPDTAVSTKGLHEWIANEMPKYVPQRKMTP